MPDKTLSPAAAAAGPAPTAQGSCSTPIPHVHCKLTNNICVFCVLTCMALRPKCCILSLWSMLPCSSTKAIVLLPFQHCCRSRVAWFLMARISGNSVSRSYGPVREGGVMRIGGCDFDVKGCDFIQHEPPGSGEVAAALYFCLPNDIEAMSTFRGPQRLGRVLH